MQIPFLQSGDTIGIAATARKISIEEIKPSVDIFESWGLKVKLSSTLFEADNQFAGSDSQRAAGFQELLNDDEVKAIICARGGYGTVRIIDLIDFSQFKKNPKWIIGFSDITVLHNHIHTHFGLPTLHATMPLNMQPEKADAESISTLHKILFGSKNFTIEAPKHSLNRAGTVSGKLVGGNLSVLYSLLGSASDIDTASKILFLEDLDEYIYHIDRMMVNMKRTGKLRNLAGLVVGGMSDMKDNTIPFGKTAEDSIREHVNEFSFPVCFAIPAGHERRNLPLMLGADYHLSINDLEAKLALIP